MTHHNIKSLLFSASLSKVHRTFFTLALGAVTMTACNGGSTEPTVKKHECPIVESLYVELNKPVTELVPVESNGKWGYLYSDGDTAVFPAYDTATDFVNGKATVLYEGILYSVSIDGCDLLGVPTVSDKIN